MGCWNKNIYWNSVEKIKFVIFTILVSRRKSFRGLEHSDQMWSIFLVIKRGNGREKIIHLVDFRPYEAPSEFPNDVILVIDQIC